MGCNHRNYTADLWGPCSGGNERLLVARWQADRLWQRGWDGADMASNVNVGAGLAPALASTISSSLYCRACGAANPVQVTHCVACREPFSTSTGGPATNPLTGLLLPR